MLKTLLGLSQIVLIFLCVAAFVRLAGRRDALRATGDVWREMPRRPAAQFMVFVWLAIFLIDVVETASEEMLNQAHRLDFTRIVYTIEGSLVGRIQALCEWPPLTVVLSFAYLILFPALLLGLAHAYDRQDDPRRVRMVAFVYAVNYFLCLPFYLFVPVIEPHMFSHYPMVRALSDLHVFPWLLDILRPMSGVDNCFPSYHTALTVSLVLIAWESGPKLLARSATVVGTLIVFSTFYLGFHWMIDVLAGVVTGWIGYALAERVVTADSPHFMPLPAPVDSDPGGGR